jgi:hypothetical protein
LSAPAERPPATLSIEEIVQALKARAGFDVLFPEGQAKRKLIEFVSRLRGDYPDAYDIIGLGAWIEKNRILKRKALGAMVGMTDSNPADPGNVFDWSSATQHDLLRGVMDLTVSMRGGKGRQEGVEISKTAPIQGERGRWSWRKD